MPIQVTCPKCLKRFQVSDKFAGKTGPCPACKNQIRVPELDEQVVIHAPDDGAPKTRSGESVLKPLKRSETDVTRKGLLITAGAILAAIGIAIGLRVTGGVSVVILAIGALAVAPPLVWAGYTFVRDSELAPYVGAELRNRVLIGSVLFSALWLLYAFVPAYVADFESPSDMSFMWFGIIFSAMLIIGALISVGTFELEFASGLAHVGLYLIATLLLALLSGAVLATGTPVP
ncbi:hypothetical protein [Rubripirellula reticaptiva]|uniref:Uncharacterized protein n=1 Tax=Rubripirellula reticaptiva TaxID=2528013 RepID=A0A5C6FCD1_9BACT|nr:hypothetical protein [Rubripirellula reticaptiva]TWU58280.1 hypothetical protein Poly59_11910 [Rubripirellula reticaptiva]